MCQVKSCSPRTLLPKYSLSRGTPRGRAGEGAAREPHIIALVFHSPGLSKKDLANTRHSAPSRKTQNRIATFQRCITRRLWLLITLRLLLLLLNPAIRHVRRHLRNLRGIRRRKPIAAVLRLVARWIKNAARHALQMLQPPCPIWAPDSAANIRRTSQKIASKKRVAPFAVRAAMSLGAFADRSAALTIKKYSNPLSRPRMRKRVSLIPRRLRACSPRDNESRIVCSFVPAPGCPYDVHRPFETT